MSQTYPTRFTSAHSLILAKVQLHLQLEGEKVVFSIYHFIEDTRRAMVMYLYDLVMEPEENRLLIQRFEQRFNKKDGTASVMAKSE